MRLMMSPTDKAARAPIQTALHDTGHGFHSE
jgi:hypothetical protein